MPALVSASPATIGSVIGWWRSTTQIEQRFDGLAPIAQGVAEIAATLIARPFDVAQRDGRAGKLRADRAAEKLALMKEPHLGQVARVVAQHHALADIGREGGIDIAHALKAHAVRLDLAHLGNRQKQQIEML